MKDERKFLRIDEDAIVSYSIISDAKIKERRRYARIKEDDSVGYVVIPSSKSVHSLSRDLSIGGIRFLSHHFIPEHSFIKIEIRLKHTQKIINAILRLVWIKEIYEDERYDVGAEFIQINKDDLEFLEYYLSRTP